MNLQAINRGYLIKNLSTNTFKKMNNLIDILTIVCDGTHLQYQKSSNNEYQQKSYSGQKKPPHLTIYFVYVIVLLGPYYANTKDAKILEELLYDNPDFQNLLSPGDVFV